MSLLLVVLLCLACGKKAAQPADAAKPDAVPADAARTGLAGVVTDSMSETKLAAVKVTLISALPTLETTTDKDGSFFLPIRPGANVLRFDKPGMWSVVRGAYVPYDGELEVEMLSTKDMKRLMGALGRKQDPHKGVVDVRFVGHKGGETVRLSSPADAAFSFNKEEMPITAAVLPTTGTTSLSFTNVHVGTTTLSVVGKDDVTDCIAALAEITEWPVFEATVTVVNAHCVNL